MADRKRKCFVGLKAHPCRKKNNNKKNEDTNSTKTGETKIDNWYM